MIIFHKYEIRLVPGKTALELYAPNWEQAEQSKNYQDLLSVHHPRRLQVVDFQHWYHNQEPTRDATPQEVERYIKDGTYLRDDSLEIFDPFYTFRYFGDESVLKPLNQKLQAEYDAYLADWKICMGRSRTEFFDRLEEVCTVQTVFENIQNCGHAYPPEYMEQLLWLENPLHSLSNAYRKTIGFPIQPEVMHMLKNIERDKEVDPEYYQKDPEAAFLHNHAERMALLDRNLDGEFSLHEQAWGTLNLGGVIDKAMEIFSIRQLYHSLKYDKELYPAGQLDSMAALAEPMERNRVWFVGEREIQMFTLNEMEQVLPQMFPDTVVQPDQWDTENCIADTPQATDGIQIKAGKEAGYRAFVEKNSEDFYSLGVIGYMERWGKMMEDAIAQGETVAAAAERTRFEADTEGITGYMYNCAVAALSAFWQYGEELRCWHNQEYGYSGSGVVNTAVLVATQNGESDEDETPESGIGGPVL